MKTSFKIQKFKQHKIHFRAIKKSSARGKHRELFFLKVMSKYRKEEKMPLSLIYKVIKHFNRSE